jgi:chromosomal replication initiation ATPase DnaA
MALGNGLPVVEQYVFPEVVYLGGADLVATWGLDATAAYRAAFDRVARADALLVDDLDLLDEIPQALQEIVRWVEIYQRSERQVVLTTRFEPADLQGLDQRSRDRAESWAMVRMGAPSDAKAIVETLAQQSDAAVDEDLAHLVEAEQPVGMWRLRGAATRLQVRRVTTGTQPRTSDDGDAASEVGRPSVSSKLDMAAIIRAVASHHGLKDSDLVGGARDLRTARARQEAMALGRDALQLSFLQIGLVFGRDPSSVLYSCRRIAAAQAKDATIQHDLRAIRAALGLRQSSERVE